jgi:hypothetical protein
LYSTENKPQLLKENNEEAGTAVHDLGVFGSDFADGRNSGSE